MATISLCMIVKNEEQVLDRCLSCVADIVDEIIIADTGSTDKTKEIAAKYTDKIYDFEWIKDFAAARNFAFSHGTKEWLMWLDADDYLTDADRENLRKLKSSLPLDADSVMCRYNLSFDGAGNPTFFSTRERMVKNDGQPRWHGAIHEYMQVRGRTITSDFAVNHGPLHQGNTERNIGIFENMLATGAEFSPREMYYYARELYYSGRYQESIEWLEKFLGTDGGWVEDKIEACNMLGRMHEGDASLVALFRSFAYDMPRSEICCAIGDRFLAAEKYAIAAYWYKRALVAQPPKLAFADADSCGYTPAAQLCLCYWKLGDLAKAEEYNNKAAEFKPYAESVEYNRKFFEEHKRSIAVAEEE